MPPADRSARLEEKVDTLIDTVGALNIGLARLGERVDAHHNDQSQQIDQLRSAFREGREATARDIAREEQDRREADNRLAADIAALRATIGRAFTWASTILGTVIAAGLVYLLYTTR